VRQFLLQLTGESGSGKSTLAMTLGRETRAVVIDKDIIKSRLLDGDELGLVGLPEDIAAPLHHALVFDLSRSFLDQGFSVIVDGAAFYPQVRTRGRAIAEAAGAAYLLIECFLPDLVTLQARIDAKSHLTSYPRVASLAGFERPGATPLTEPCLRIDTRRPLGTCLAEALDYIRNG